jgi:hypothetical protein
MNNRACRKLFAVAKVITAASAGRRFHTNDAPRFSSFSCPVFPYNSKTGG